MDNIGRHDQKEVTKEEFIAKWEKGHGMTVEEWNKKMKMDLKVVECDCTEPYCKGWKIRALEPA